MDEPLWLTKAREMLGTKETPGPLDNPAVVRLYAEAGHPEVDDDETAWCAAFVNAMLGRAGVQGTDSLLARSFLKWGHPLRVPQPGCIVVFKRGSSTWQGHVAFYIGDGPGIIRVLGGNQRNSVSIANYRDADWLAYRWPVAVE